MPQSQIDTAKLNLPPQMMSVSDATFTGFTGIAISGAWYAGLTIGLYYLFLLFGSLFGGWFFGARFDPTMFIGFLIIFLFGIGIGFAIAGVVGGFACIFVASINKSLRYIWDPLTAIALSGAAAGFFSTFWIVTWALAVGTPITLGLALLVGPLMGMVFGHVFAIRYGIREINRFYLKQKAIIPVLVDDPIKKDFRQFEIRDMLVAMIWFGVAFTAYGVVFKLSPGLGYAALIYWVLQPIVFPVVQRLMMPYIYRELSVVWTKANPKLLEELGPNKAA